MIIVKIYLNKTINLMLNLMVVLILVGCSMPEHVQAHVVLVESIQKADRISLRFHCLDTSDCYAPAQIPEYADWIPAVNISRNGDLLIPFRTQAGDKYGEVGYVQASKKSQKIVKESFPVPKKFDYLIEQIIFVGNRMVFTIEGDDHVYILDVSGKIKEILVMDIDSDTAHYRIVKGNNGEIIVVGRSLQKQGDKHLINISTIFLQDYSVETRLIPWPESAAFNHPITYLPGKKYDIIVDGITSDQKMLYYRSVGLNDKLQVTQQIGVYNIQTMQDKTYQFSEPCIGNRAFAEYRGYLAKGGFRSDMGVSDLPFLIAISDFRPIIDFKEVEINSKFVNIVPFGDSFLIAFEKKIVQIDFSGNVLKEFLIPPDLVHRNYVIAQLKTE